MIDFYAGTDTGSLHRALEQFFGETIDILPDSEGDHPLNIMLEEHEFYAGAGLIWPLDYSPVVSDSFVIAQSIQQQLKTWVIFSLDGTPYGNYFGFISKAGNVSLIYDWEFKSKGRLRIWGEEPFPSQLQQAAA